MAGSKTDSYEIAVLELVFHNVVGTALAGLGLGTDIQPTGTAGSVYVSLHTADPGETGAHTGEVVVGDYAEYARIAVPRALASWTLTTPSPTKVANAAAVSYVQSTGPGSANVTHFGINKTLAGTGVGEMLYQGSLQSSLVVNVGVQPEFAIGALVVQES